MTNSPLIYVDLVRSSSRLPLRRPQRWKWIARSADNGRVLATSSERYTNRRDVEHAVELLFGADSNVYLREAEQGNRLLRLAASNDWFDEIDDPEVDQ